MLRHGFHRPLWVLACLFLFLGSCQSGEGGEDPSSRSDSELAVTQDQEIEDWMEKWAGNCPPCSVSNLCDPVCQAAQLQCHSISQEEFSNRIHSPQGHNPFSDMASFCQIIHNADCQNQMVILKGQAGMGNEDIQLEVVNIQRELIRVGYPLSLFRAFCESNPQSIHFYKGVSGTGEKDILIRLIMADGDTQYYDLSDTAPPIDGRSKE